MLIALYLALVESPSERVQGIHQKIFYIHVPSALIAYISIGVVAFGSAMYLWKRTPHWDRLAYASAEIGVILTTLTLVTGSLWGRPVWGAWWNWSDARLVTTLVMWLVYVAYLMLRSLGDRGPGTSRAAAVIGILGAVNIPITYFSVYFVDVSASIANATVVGQAGERHPCPVPGGYVGVHASVRLL